jgi:hypothetical protein
MHPPKQRQAFTKNGKGILIWLLLCTCLVFLHSCHDETEPVVSTFMPVKPTYSDIRLVTRDTLRFPLEKDCYNKIKSFNYFVTNNGSAYIGFFDRLSASVMIYDFPNRRLVKKVSLTKIVKDKKFYKTSVYVKNFDSLYVTNYDKLYLMDSSGDVHNKVTFNSVESMAFFETPLPVIFKNNRTLMGVRPFVKERSLSAIKEWRTICEFNMEKDECDLYYPLPDVYKKGLYGRRFLQYSYCYNDKQNFVFSFPADSNIYETNLTDFHLAYSGKSKFQTGPIEPVEKEALENDRGGEEYTMRDSYGPIYYDPYTKRYLRIAKQKVSKAALATKTTRRKSSVIVFDQQFKIIGEFICNDDYELDTVFFTADGCIYARINPGDQNALDFVRLAWTNEPDESMHLTKK